MANLVKMRRAAVGAVGAEYREFLQSFRKQVLELEKERLRLDKKLERAVERLEVVDEDVTATGYFWGEDLSEASSLANELENQDHGIKSLLKEVHATRGGVAESEAEDAEEESAES